MRGDLPIPTEPMLHTLGNGQSVIRYIGKDARGFKTVRNHKLGTVDEAEANRLLTTFKKEWSEMQEANGQAFKGTEEQRAKWRKDAADRRVSKGMKPRKAKNQAPEARADAQGGVVPGTALVPVTEQSKQNVHQRNFYTKRKVEAEHGKATVEAVRKINEHVAVLAANLEVASRTLKMIRVMIDELELEP